METIGTAFSCVNKNASHCLRCVPSFTIAEFGNHSLVVVAMLGATRCWMRGHGTGSLAVEFKATTQCNDNHPNCQVDTTGDDRSEDRHPEVQGVLHKRVALIGSLSPWVLPERTLGTVRYTETYPVNYLICQTVPCLLSTVP